MKIPRLLISLLLISQFVFPPQLRAEELPYSLVDKSQYDIFAEDQQAAEKKAL